MIDGAIAQRKPQKLHFTFIPLTFRAFSVANCLTRRICELILARHPESEFVQES